MSSIEIEKYLGLFQGEKVPLSTFNSQEIKNNIRGLLRKDRLVGQYNLDKELIIFDPKQNKK